MQILTFLKALGEVWWRHFVSILIYAGALIYIVESETGLDRQELIGCQVQKALGVCGLGCDNSRGQSGDNENQLEVWQAPLIN